MIVSTLIYTFNRQNLPHILIAFLITLMALAIVGCSMQPTMLTTPNSLQIAMDDSAQLRSQAKQRVLLVKQEEEKRTIKVEDYKLAKELYEAARNSIELWINRLQGDLRSGKPVDNPAEYNALVENVSTRAKNFNEYVDQLTQAVPRGNAAKNVESFVKAGIKLIETIQKIDRQKRIQLISELEALRWQAFDDL